MSTPAQPSAALLAANQKLFALRKRHQVEKRVVNPETSSDIPPWVEIDDVALLAKLPDHIGWGSQPLSDTLRRAGTHVHHSGGAEEKTSGKWLAALNRERIKNDQRPGLVHNQVEPDSRTPSAPQTVKLYPDIALGMLQHEASAAGRVWLLLRTLDEEGRGWLSLDTVRDRLTCKESVYFLVGNRQLRKLLKRGENLFWTRANDRLWLRSAAKVAAALGVSRLEGHPVALPISVLLAGVGAVRAHFYASFHSGRKKQKNKDRANPISRATIAKKTGVSQRTQYEYEQRLGLEKTKNIAVGPRQCDQEVAKEWYWRHGSAAFTLHDHKGRHGRAGHSYHARQLPNSYTGCHSQIPKGKQKQINRKLKDLVINEAPGNISEPSKCFFPDGREAARIISKGNKQELFWQRQQNQRLGTQLWYVMAE